MRAFRSAALIFSHTVTPSSLSSSPSMMIERCGPSDGPIDSVNMATSFGDCSNTPLNSVSS